MKKICFVDVLGLCYDGNTLERRGLGGSESAIIYMSKELVKLGYRVEVFNDCISDDCKPGVYDGVWFRPLSDIELIHEPYDIAIASRSVAPFFPGENRFKSFIPLPDFSLIQRYAKHKILYQHDTFIDGDDLIEDLLLQGHINEIFTLSDWHTSYITNCDHGKKRDPAVLKKHIFQTRNGIGHCPEWIDINKKNKDLFVYNASATKGLQPLYHHIWPRIKEQIPSAKFVVIGGYYKFREGSEPDEQQKQVMDMANNVDFNNQMDITFTGVIRQADISNILRNASFFLYPSAFPETYGISTLEALAHNVPIVTCERGALEEVAIDIASYKIPYPIQGDWACPWLNNEDQIEKFVIQTVAAYHNTYLHQQKMYACNQVKDICTWESVAKQWDQHFHKVLGDYLPVDSYREVSKINYRVSEVFGRRFSNPEQKIYPKDYETSFAIMTPVWNAEDYIEKCILSVAAQDYNDYRMYIIDDCSTDNTLDKAYRTIQELPREIRDNFIVIHNDERMGALANQVNVIFDRVSEEVIMLLDGDDWLVNDPNIFNKYNDIYKGDVDMTYGSCWSVADNIPLIAQEYPPEVKANKSYREYSFNWGIPYTHFRTFRLSLIDDISCDEEKLLLDEDGKHYKAGGDGALLYALLEAAEPDRIKVVSDVVYCYNDKNPANDYKVNSEEQTRNAKAIKEKNPNSNTDR